MINRKLNLKKENKTNRSILNSITSVLLMLLNGLFNIIVVRKIINVYGSDFNGLNSTATQFINILMIVEGGFGLAANVSLFEPLAQNDKLRVNSIISAVYNQFKKIGFIFLILGLVFSIVFSGFIKTDLPIYITLLTFIMLVVSTALNLAYATTYKIAFQSNQQEYILNAISIFVITLTNIIIIIAIKYNAHELIIRLIVMILAILQSLLIIGYCKKKYKYLDINTKPAYGEIQGTKDVFTQKIVGLIYSSMPILFISSFVGTAYSSVYAVYNTVFVLIKGLNLAFINAPRMGLGKLIKERKNNNYINKIFNQYEFVSFYLIACMMSVAIVLIMPFVDIYTTGVTDVEYQNWYIASALIAITIFEMIHIPSGNIINMSGNFKVGRDIQIISGVVLVIMIIFGSIYFGVYGILSAILVTAILLAVLEIYYVHQKYLRGTWLQFLKSIISCSVSAIILVYIELKIDYSITSFFTFFYYALILLVINSLIILLTNLILNNKITVEVLYRIKSNIFN